MVYFWVIPCQTESVQSICWLKPTTLPRIATLIFVIAGLLHFFFPSGTAEFDVKFSLRMGLFFGISVVGLIAMHFIGFVIAAPLLVLVIMLLIGERRPLWLFASIVFLPALIWFCVDCLLNKPLP